MIEATDPAGAAADRREAAQAMASAEALLSMSVDRA
jgi:hypothetical protein